LWAGEAFLGSGRCREAFRENHCSAPDLCSAAAGTFSSELLFFFFFFFY